MILWGSCHCSNIGFTLDWRTEPTMNDVAPPLLRRSPVSFDAEKEDERLARRKRGWIADVDFSYGA